MGEGGSGAVDLLERLCGVEEGGGDECECECECESTKYCACHEIWVHRHWVSVPREDMDGCTPLPRTSQNPPAVSIISN